jgi:hypothetical protein
MELLYATTMQLGDEDTKVKIGRIEAKKDVESAVRDVMLSNVAKPT